MRVTLYLLACLATFMTFYFILSGIGCLFLTESNQKYVDVVSNLNWFMLYTLFFGWWITLICNIELYTRLKINEILN